MIRLCQPQIGDAAVAAVSRVLRSGQLVHGAEGRAFEAELAAYLNCAEAVLVSSGTAALHLALMALDIGPGDAVLVPDFTYPATAHAVRLVGATVVLIDVDPLSYVIEPHHLRAALSRWQGPERLRAIIPVHEFGAPVAMPEVMELARAADLLVIEDAACALGGTSGDRKLGTFGAMGCFSFHPRKTLTTGEGGLVCCHDAALAERLRSLRSHGAVRREDTVRFSEIGPNYRLTDFQAAMGRVQLPLLDGWIATRRHLADRYRHRLAVLEREGLIRLPASRQGHSHQTFMVVLPEGCERAAVIAELAAAGIEANLGAQSLSCLGLYGSQDGLRVGPELFQRGLAIPLHESLSEQDIERVCQTLATVLRA